MLTRSKRWINVLIAGALLLFACLPEGHGLTRPMLTAAGVLLASLWLWFSEALPMSISILVMIGVSVLFRLLSVEEAAQRLDINTALFILFSAAITAAVSLSSIPQRLTRWILRCSHGRSNTFIIGFGMIVTLCSSIMSSLATCAMFASLVNSMLGSRRTNLKRCLMMIIPACAGIGGFITPAGTPANLLLLSLLEKNHTPLTFAKWCVIGLPAGLIASLLFLLSILLLFRPSVDDLQQTGSECPSAASSRRDRLTFLVICFILAGWFFSSWIPGLQLWHVAGLGVAAMLLPGAALLKMRDLAHHIHWDLVITMGTIGILMGAVSDSGLTAWLSERLLSPFAKLPILIMLPCLSLLLCLIRTLVPTTTGMVTLLAPVLLDFAALTGQHPGSLLMLLGFWTASALLVVWTEPIYLLTWTRRDYSARDLFKAGSIPSLLMAFLGVWLIRALAMGILLP